MVDVSLIVPGAKIKVKDGAVLIVDGSYLSNDGLVITAKYEPGSVCARNILLSQIIEVANAS